MVASLSLLSGELPPLTRSVSETADWILAQGLTAPREQSKTRPEHEEQPVTTCALCSRSKQVKWKFDVTVDSKAVVQRVEWKDEFQRCVVGGRQVSVHKACERWTPSVALNPTRSDRPVLVAKDIMTYQKMV